MLQNKQTKNFVTATSAGMGGIFSTLCLYPLDTLKTRIQSNTYHTNEKKKDLLNFLSLYKGVEYKAIESYSSKFLYFYIHSTLFNLMSSKNNPLTIKKSILIGYLSEGLHLPLTLPIEVIITKLQTSKNKSFLTIINEIWNYNNNSKNTNIFKKLNGFYTGASAYFFLCLHPAIQYTIFEQLKKLYLKKYKKSVKYLNSLQAFIIGAFARSIATLILFPFIRAKVYLQARDKKEIIDETCTIDNSNNIIGIIKKLYKENGFLSLYTGLIPELTKGALSSALMLMVKEKIEIYIKTIVFGIMILMN